MKKTIALVLCLLMVVSLAACGGQTTADDSSASAKQTETAGPATVETEQPEESSEPVETEPVETEPVETEPVETEPVETEPVETEPAFDTSWAGDEYVMPIPAPPVTEFKIMEGGSRGGGVALQFTSTDVQDLTRDEVEAYRQTLESLGYVNGIYEKDFDNKHGYEFSAQNENGDTVYINYTDSYFVLVFEFSK